MTLDCLKIGESAVIKTVGGTGALRRRLLDMGLTPKTQVTMRKMAPMGDPIEICLRGYELTLRKEDAQKIELLGEGESLPRYYHGSYHTQRPHCDDDPALYVHHHCPGHGDGQEE